jgi:hypothetical protein
MKIELNSGREIFLNSIYQEHTYEGLLAGYPNKEMNDRYIKRNMESALEKMSATKAYLVSPPMFEVEVHKKIRHHYKDALRMPYIVCFGQFDSSVLKRDDINDGSCLTIVWYQDDFAMPIDESVIEHIKTIDWEKEAEGYQF